jgi:predicted AAA+ superfamily ATPase
LVLLERIRDKILTRDIPSVAKLTMDELDLLSKLLRFVGRSAIDGISYTTLSSNLGITKYKAQQYAGLLDQAFVLQLLLPAGTGVLKEPKLLMMPPYRLLYGDYADQIGGLREDFAAMALAGAGYLLTYLKSSCGAKTPDFLIEHAHLKWAIEVGGKGKGREQFKGISVDRKLIFADREIPDAKRLPLFLLGFLY